MRPVVLKNLSPYLSMHMKNIRIGGCTRPVRQFEGMVILDPEIDSMSDSAILIWIGYPPWHAYLLVSTAPS
jgi:hypothetical protein